MQLSCLAVIVSASFMLLPPLSAASEASGTRVISPFQHLSVTSSGQQQVLNQSSYISVAYFFVKYSPKVEEFLREYKKSAKFLKVYNITLALYNCISDMSIHEMCKKDLVEDHVYTYQNETELLTFTLDTMFDVNSIMANILQLALLHQVPIIQSRQELYELQRSAIGRHDILFAYFTIGGTKEHRIFLEVAYAFQDRFKFALTTEFKVTQDLQNNDLLIPKVDFAMFVLFCAESTVDTRMSADGLCHNVLYQGEVSFTDVALFVKTLTEKTLFYVPADGLGEVFDMPDNLPIIFVYLNKQLQDHVFPVAELAKFELRGVAKVIVVDMDDDDSRALAVQQGFSGKLPVLGVKQDGVLTFLDQYKEWSSDNVQEFIRFMVFPPEDVTSGSNPGMTYSTDFEPYSELIEKVQTQDDQIAEAVIGLSQVEMQLENVPALLKLNFSKAVMSADLKMVLFYLPFDHISMALLRVFGHAAQTLAKNLSEPNVLARVNCYDGTDLCAAENITTYPQLRIYRRGHVKQNYLGSLDSRSVIKAVKLLRLNSPVQLAKAQDVELFLKGDHPETFQNFTPSSVLLLTSKKDTDLERIFNKVSRSLSTITAFGVTHGDVSTSFAKIYSLPVPSVMAVHRSDPNTPIRSLNQPISELSLTEFVKNSIIALLPELTPMSLPTLYASKQPFAILYLDSSHPRSTKAKEILTQIAMSGQLKDIIFCWMNVQAKTMGHKLLSEYTWVYTLPMITVVNHELGELFNFQPKDLNLEDTSEWLTRVLTKRIRPSKMLKYSEWKPPGPHFDFLAMIDKMEKDDQPAIDAINDEHLFIRQHNRDQYSLGIPQNDADHEEALRIDNELREELIELQKSRICYKSPERRDGNRNHFVRDQESSTSHKHQHTEL